MITRVVVAQHDVTHELYEQIPATQSTSRGFERFVVNLCGRDWLMTGKPG